MPLYECSDTVYRTSAAKAKTQTSPAAGASESQPRSTIGSKIDACCLKCAGHKNAASAFTVPRYLVQYQYRLCLCAGLNNYVSVRVYE